VIFKVYSDGSGMTGGPAGIGFVAYVDDELLLMGNLPVTSATNHQAELRAAAFALNSIPEGQDVELLSDSEYVVKNFNEYLPRWRERGWRNTGGNAVANHALWEELIGAVKRHRSSASSGRRGTMAPRATSTPTGSPVRRGGWRRGSTGSTSSRRRSPQRSPDLGHRGGSCPDRESDA
jgi:ribonuclease HI